jgi:hypothetical protein
MNSRSLGKMCWKGCLPWFITSVVLAANHIEMRAAGEDLQASHTYSPIPEPLLWSLNVTEAESSRIIE